MAQPRQGFAHPYFPHLDPERRWLFRLEFTLSGLEIGDILSFNAQSVTLPSITFDPIIIPHMNQDVKVAGRPTLGEMTVVFLTAYNLDTINILERWHRLIYRPSVEEMGFAAEYKADGQLLILKPDLSEFKTYTFKGAWPLTIGDKEYDWSASENVTRTVTFAVDKVLDPEDSNIVQVIT
jgi:hypothetical protein